MPVIGAGRHRRKGDRSVERGAKIHVLTGTELLVGVQTPVMAHRPPTTGIASGEVGSHDLVVEFDAGTAVLRSDQIVTSPQSTLFPSGLAVARSRRPTNQPGTRA